MYYLQMLYRGKMLYSILKKQMYFGMSPPFIVFLSQELLLCFQKPMWLVLPDLVTYIVTRFPFWKKSKLVQVKRTTCSSTLSFWTTAVVINFTAQNYPHKKHAWPITVPTVCCQYDSCCLISNHKYQPFLFQYSEGIQGYALATFTPNKSPRYLHNMRLGGHYSHVGQWREKYNPSPSFHLCYWWTVKMHTNLSSVFPKLFFYT
jgi:hypothetical protein